MKSETIYRFEVARNIETEVEDLVKWWRQDEDLVKWWKQDEDLVKWWKQDEDLVKWWKQDEDLVKWWRQELEFQLLSLVFDVVDAVPDGVLYDLVLRGTTHLWKSVTWLALRRHVMTLKDQIICSSLNSP